MFDCLIVLVGTGAVIVATIESTRARNCGEAKTCRIVIGICRSPRCRHWMPARVERRKSSSSVAVIGLDCSVGRKPSWNCFSLSMKSLALALAESLIFISRLLFLSFSQWSQIRHL